MAETSPYDIISPGFSAQQAKLSYQQMLAQQLMQNGMQAPQGQMVGPVYVKPSPVQYISRLAQTLMGAKMMQNSFDQQTKLAQALYGQPQGSTAAPQAAPQGAAMFGMGQAQPNQVQPAAGQAAGVASQTAGPLEAPGPGMSPHNRMLYAADPKSYMDAYLAQGAPTPEMKNAQFAGGDDATARQLIGGKMQKEGTIEYQPGAMTVGPGGQVVVAPDFKAGTYGGFDASGRPVENVIPGAPGAQAAITGAQEWAKVNPAIAMEAGKQGEQYTTVKTPSGQEIRTPQKNINGIPTGPTMASGAYTPEQAKNFAGYENALNGRVETGQNMIMRNEEALKLMQGYAPGAGADVKLGISKYLDAMGMHDLATKVNGGQVSNAQALQKLFLTGAMEATKQSMQTDSGMAGRMTQAEFLQMQKALANINTTPDAIRFMMGLTHKLYDKDFAEQQELQKAKSAGTFNPLTWPAEWSKRWDANLQTDSVPKNGFVSQKTLQDYATAHGMDINAARQFLEGHGVKVQ